MPRGDKDKYTDKEKRQAEHVEQGYESRGIPEKEAERRAWATVNKVHGGGEKPGGGGYGKPENHEPMKREGAREDRGDPRQKSMKKGAAIRITPMTQSQSTLETR